MGMQGHCSNIGMNVEARVGKMPFAARYHKKQRKLEDDYELSCDVLGSGMTGDVTMAFSKSHPDQKFAVKTCRYGSDDSDQAYRASVEVQNYLCLDHPHIARLCDVYETKHQLHLVMECMEGGDVFQRLKAKKQFPEHEAREAMRQMLLAVNYMHSHGMVHRDIKLENYVYDKKDGNHLKLIDFGFSTVWSPQSGEKLDRCCGTLAYCAPEVLHKNATSKCDLWSLGVVGFIMLSGRMPFYGTEAEQRANICAGAYTMQSEYWSGVSEEAQDFIRSLLKVDPANRLSAQQALAHPWIAHGPTTSQDGMAQVVQSLRMFSCASKARRFLMRTLALSLSSQEQAKVRDHFLAFDGNQQGTITVEELNDVMVHHLHVSDEIHMLQAFRRLDYNNDQEIHYSDFLAAMLGTSIDITESMVESGFRRLDKDGSGYITAGNLQDFMGSDESIESFIQEVDRLHKGRICYSDLAAYLRIGTSEQKYDFGQVRARLQRLKSSLEEAQIPVQVRYRTSSIEEIMETELLQFERTSTTH
jgi:calcium-dependent protein kinase